MTHRTQWTRTDAISRALWWALAVLVGLCVIAILVASVVVIWYQASQIGPDRARRIVAAVFVAIMAGGGFGCICASFFAMILWRAAL